MKKTPVLAPVYSMSVTQEDFWEDVCFQVVNDAIIDEKSIVDTVNFLKNKYIIELKELI